MTAVVVDHENIAVEAGSNRSTVAPFRDGKPKKRDPKNNVNRPDPSRWAQQRLPMWEPMLTLNWSIFISLVIAGTCIALGFIIIIESAFLNSYRVVYDDGPGGQAVAEQVSGHVHKLDNCRLDTPDQANSFDAAHTCFVNITLLQAIHGRAYVFYELTGFYQHHRRFVSSMDRTQFTDEWRPGLPLTTCAPMETIDSVSCEAGTCPTSSQRRRKLFPCGIVANTMFNDIFWLHEGILPSGERLGPTDMISKGIARTYPTHPNKNPTWAMTPDEYLAVWQNPNFSRIIPPAQGDQRPHLTSDYSNSTAWVHDPTDPAYGVGTGLENEHWRVWVETAARQPFRKPYARIYGDLPEGTTLVFAVQSNFFVRSFSGRKAIVVGELSWFGSDNVAMGGIFLAVGGIFLIFTLFFAIRRCTKPRKLGDASVLKWKHGKAE